MRVFAAFLFVIVLSSVCFTQTCVGGKWDITSNVWYTDCTGDRYDGRYTDGAYSSGYSAFAGRDTLVTLANGATHRFYWKLYYFNSVVAPGLPVPDSIPLLAGIHCWSNSGSTLDQLFDAGNLFMGSEPGAERVISLVFSIDISENDAGTWWWGGKVNNVPTPWAEEEIVRIIRQRLSDACDLLAAAGAAELSGRHIDVNRVYLRGHSMGGTGAYRMGIKHPELFSAVFCHAGFADFKGNPCGTQAFCDFFDESMVGTASQNLQTRGIDGKQYPARDYTDMSWFVGTHRGVSWEAAYGNGRKYEPPFIYMRHGTADNAVNISSADRIHTVLERGKWGYAYQRDGGGHSESNGSRVAWMLNMRKNQSYLGFSNNSTNTSSEFNYLDKIGWRPSSIADQTNRYEVQLTGTAGHTDVTLHRLQNFVVSPLKPFHFWIGAKSGTGTAVTADANGFLTLPSINAGSKIIIEPDEPTAVKAPGTRAAAPVSVVLRNAGPGVILLELTAVRSIPGEWSATLYTCSGRLAGTLRAHETAGGGVAPLRWEVGDRSGGTYIVQLRNRGFSVIRPVTVR